MKYVIWTPAEEHALCQALAHAWMKYGITTVHQDNFKMLITLAGDSLQEPDSVLAAKGDWRTRTLKSRDARFFIEKHREVLMSLMNSGVERAYVVDGYERPMTADEMREEIARLNIELKACHAKLAPPKPEPQIVVRPPKQECDGVYRPQALAPKKRVAIAGLHDKHRDTIARRFPHFDIKWIEQRDNDSQIKAKASGRVCIACTYGTNGNVLKLLHNISQCHTVGGASGVRDVLANIQ